MPPVVHFGLLIACSVLVGSCSIINKEKRMGVLERNEMKFPEEVKKGDGVQIEKSDMNVIACWICKKSVHQLKGLVLREINKEIKAVCREMKVFKHICKQHAYKYQHFVLHLLFPHNSKQTCQHLKMCK